MRREGAEVRAVLGVGPLGPRVAVSRREGEPPRDGNRGTPGALMASGIVIFRGVAARQGRSLKYTGGPSSGRPSPSQSRTADSRRKTATSAAPRGAVEAPARVLPAPGPERDLRPEDQRQGQARRASRTRAGPPSGATTQPTAGQTQVTPSSSERAPARRAAAGRGAGRGSSSSRAGSPPGPCTSGRRRDRRRRRTRSGPPPAFTRRASATSSSTSPATARWPPAASVGVTRDQDEDPVGGGERGRGVVHPSPAGTTGRGARRRPAGRRAPRTSA